MARLKTTGGILLGFLLLATLKSEAQDYGTAIGLRFGGTTGFDIKHNYGTNSAFEGIVGFFDNGMSLTFLWEKHPQAFDVPGLYWYYGGGPHVAFYNDNDDRFGWGGSRDINDRDGGDFGIGINGIIGLEYVFPDDVPIAVSVDIKPFIEFSSGGNVGAAPDPGLGIKFLF